MFYSGIVENTERPVADGNAAMASLHGESGFDPVPVLQAVNTPTLWLLGLDDHSIPVLTTLGIKVGRSAVGRFLQRLQLTFKKNSSRRRAVHAGS